MNGDNKKLTLARCKELKLTRAILRNEEENIDRRLPDEQNMCEKNVLNIGVN